MYFMAVLKYGIPRLPSLERGTQRLHCFSLILILPQLNQLETKQDLAVDHCHKQQI